MRIILTPVMCITTIFSMNSYTAQLNLSDHNATQPSCAGVAAAQGRF